MFANLTVTKILAAAAVGGGLVLTQFGAAALAAPSTVEPTSSEYPASVVTTTDISLASTTLDQGESTTATVTVTSDAGTPQGRVTFRVSGHNEKVVPLVGGKASYQTPTDLRAGRTYKITARYDGGGVYRASQDSAYITVRGDGSVAGEEGEDGGSANRPSTGGALPNVGADSSSTLYALGGLGLLGAGAAVLLLRRRRSPA